jgi:alpha-D-xyloside xylohydrolase
VVEGGRWVREQHGYLSLPLMVRPNTVLPVGATENRPDYDYAEGVVYHIFALDEGAVATARVLALDGGVETTFETTVQARREGARIEVLVRGPTPTGRRQPWSVLLRGVGHVTLAEGGTVQQEDPGTGVVPDVGVRRVAIRLG